MYFQLSNSEIGFVIIKFVSMPCYFWQSILIFMRDNWKLEKMSLLLRYNETLIKIYYSILYHIEHLVLYYSSMLQIKESAEI